MSLFARMGDSTGQWGLAGDSIPVYSKVQGKTVYVRGDQAQAYVQNDAILFSKMRHTQGDTGLRGLSDDEVSRRARDKSLSGKERKRYQKEEKVRGNRNKQKRESNYAIENEPSSSYVPMPGPATNFTVDDSAAWATFWTVAAVAVVVVVLIPIGI